MKGKQALQNNPILFNYFKCSWNIITKIPMRHLIVLFLKNTFELCVFISMDNSTWTYQTQMQSIFMLPCCSSWFYFNFPKGEMFLNLMKEKTWSWKTTCFVLFILYHNSSHPSRFLPFMEYLLNKLKAEINDFKFMLSRPYYQYSDCINQSIDSWKLFKYKSSLLKSFFCGNYSNIEMTEIIFAKNKCHLSWEIYVNPNYFDCANEWLN